MRNILKILKTIRNYHNLLSDMWFHNISVIKKVELRIHSKYNNANKYKIFAHCEQISSNTSLSEFKINVLFLLHFFLQKITTGFSQI